MEINGNTNLAQSFATNVYFPTGIAFNKMGDLFVSCGNNAILEFTPAGTASIFATNLDDPNGLAFNSAGILFEADYLSGNINEFTTNGAQSTFVSGLKAPFGLAFDRAGNLYVGGVLSSNITKITTNGMQSTFASMSGLVEPWGLAFDHSGNLYVADVSSDNVFKYTTNGMQSTYVSLPTAPFFIAFDNTNNLYVSQNMQNGFGVITEIATNGTQIMLATNLASPEGIAFQPLPIMQGTSVGNGYQLTVSTTSPYYSAVVEASTNLVNWTGIYTNVTPFTCTDSMVVLPHRFYRTYLGP